MTTLKAISGVAINLRSFLHISPDFLINY